MNRHIAAIGESMIEIKPELLAPTKARASAQMGYGGDAMNFCVYLARLGCTPHFVSAMGDDPTSDWLVSLWHQEGVNCELVDRVKGAVPGLYLIDTDAHGERSFFYWRDQAPARQLLAEPADRERIFGALAKFPYVYLSGITLAILDRQARTYLFDFLADYRRAGGRVIFDNNYRPRLWPSTKAAATAFEHAYRCTDIALPTLDDELAVFGDATAHSTLQRIGDWGCGEIALKVGADGALISNGHTITEVPAVQVDTVVDTTSAGDSFNAGYMAARLAEQAPEQAALLGHALAAQVVQHPGAIVPGTVTDPLKHKLDAAKTSP